MRTKWNSEHYWWMDNTPEGKLLLTITFAQLVIIFLNPASVLCSKCNHYCRNQLSSNTNAHQRLSDQLQKVDMNKTREHACNE